MAPVVKSTQRARSPAPVADAAAAFTWSRGQLGDPSAASAANAGVRRAFILCGRAYTLMERRFNRLLLILQKCNGSQPLALRNARQNVLISEGFREAGIPYMGT